MKSLFPKEGRFIYTPGVEIWYGCGWL